MGQLSIESKFVGQGYHYKSGTAIVVRTGRVNHFYRLYVTVTRNFQFYFPRHGWLETVSLRNIQLDSGEPLSSLIYSDEEDM